MNQNASLSAPPRRTRTIALLGLAVLVMASAVFVVRRPLMMAAPMCVAGRWHGCFDTFNGVVLMTLVALPPTALVVWALARRRRAAASRRRGGCRWPRWVWSTGRCRSCG
ncbi:hypothetical protein ACFQ10_50410 [Streptomyces indonesiensis]